MAESCKLHPNAELRVYCPVCQATRGGKVSSPRKRAASQVSLAKARRLRWTRAREPE